MQKNELKRILLVEDDPVLAEITTFRLELLGFFVDRAKNTSDVFATLEHGHPDAIVIDLMLSGISGFDLAEHLKNNEETARIPIIALSHNADLDQVERAFNCGIEEFVVVPFDPVVLEVKLDKILNPIRGKA